MNELLMAGALMIAPPTPGMIDLSPASITVPLHAPAAAPLNVGAVAALVQDQATTPPAGDEPAPQRDIVVIGRGEWEAPDPFANVNETAFDVTQSVDEAIVAPIALAYRDTVPKPVRDGVHNFLYNLREPVVFLNYLLQLKIGKAVETAGRFAINTTIGVAGVFDMAKRRPFKLPRRSNGFANTLGFYGVRTGPFLFLPLVGPTTVRDLLGGALDRLLFPIIYGARVTRPEFALPFAVLGALDHRAEFDDTLRTLHDGQADPYARSRDFYLQRRQNEIDQLKGRGTRNSSPMSEAPTGPIELKERSPGPAVEAPPVAPTASAPGAMPIPDPATPSAPTLPDQPPR